VHKIKIGKLVFTTFLLLLTSSFIIASFSYEPRSRMVPLLIGIITFIIGLIALVNEVRPIQFLSRFDVSIIDLSGKIDSKAEAEDTIDQKLFISIGWITAFLTVTFLGGFHFGIISFMIAYLKIRGKVGWLKSIWVSIAVWGLVYLMFEVAMGFSLFRGIFFGEILPIL